MNHDQPTTPDPQRAAELTTWAVVYMLLGWLSLIAAVFGGAAEEPYFLTSGIALVPLGLGFWFRWRWSRWAGFVLLATVAGWAIWQLVNQQVWLLSTALLLMSLETMLCLRRWPREPS